jgi:hypothetical protein
MHGSNRSDSFSLNQHVKLLPFEEVGVITGFELIVLAEAQVALP